MRKKIFLLLIIFLLTGCAKDDYTLEIQDEKIKETILIDLSENADYVAHTINDVFSLVDSPENETEGNITNQFMDYMQNNELYATDEYGGTYLKKITNNKIKLSYEYNFYTFKNSTVMNSCFEDMYFQETDDYYVISGGGQFKCLVNEPVRVAIKSNYMVIDVNADNNSTNRYTWTYDKLNHTNHELYFQFSKSHKRDTTKGMVLGLILLVGVVMFVIRFIKKRYQQTKEDRW